MIPINEAVTYFIEVCEIVLRLYVIKEENLGQCLICSLVAEYCWLEVVDCYYFVSVPWFNWQYMFDSKENDTLFKDPY